MKPPASQPPFQVLALSGGGYRGLFSALVLEELERRAGRPLRECFDLVAGTSIGGILACGIAAGVPAARMRHEFEERGRRIFDRRARLPFGISVPLPKQGLLRARYSRSGLEAAVDGTLGDTAGMRVREVSTPLVVTAVNATNGKSVLFDSRGTDSMSAATLRQVALATSAAPTYFPEFNIGENSLVDGGLVANAPDAAAAIKAMSSFGQRPEEIRMLSVGTAGGVTGEVFRDGRSAGILGWMVSRNLFGLTVAAQQEMSVSLAAGLLGKGYLRIDAIPDRARSLAIGLDKADVIATATLRSLAAQAMDEAGSTRGGDLASILRHVAMRG